LHLNSTSLHPTSPRSILILSTHLHLGLPSGLFPSSWGRRGTLIDYWWESQRERDH
jgi:hypothetical protein